MSLPYDPDGEVPITPKLVTVRPKAMLNSYKRVVKVGGGQHGTVYLCLQQRKGASDLAVAMKSVQRVNEREEKHRRLQQGHLPKSPQAVSAVDKVNHTEAKIRKEIAIMKKLRHPHVVRLYEVIDDRMREKIYIVMEYLGGGEVLWKGPHKNPLLTIDQTRRIMRDAVLGLEYLHYQGIIHRDIKPANLLYTFGRSHVKIGDFGVSHFSYAQRLAAIGADAANAANQDQTDPTLLDDSALSMRAGTPVFIAPEVVWEYRLSTVKSSPSLRRGYPHSPSPPSYSTTALSSDNEGQVAAPVSTTADRISTPAKSPTGLRRPQITKALDIWALGITFFCLLTGQTPYEARNEWSLYSKIANQNIRLPATLGADLVPTGEKRVINGDATMEGEFSNGEGRQKTREDVSEGPVIVGLLEQFLQRDPANRIALEAVKCSKFILTGVPNPDDWLLYTSPTARILVDQKETSQAMSPLRFRADWGTRFVRQFSSLWSKRGPSTPATTTTRKVATAAAAGAAASNCRKGGLSTRVPHLIKAVAASSSGSTAALSPTTATSTIEQRRSRVGRSGTVSGATGRRLAASIVEGMALKALPLEKASEMVLHVNGHWSSPSKGPEEAEDVRRARQSSPASSPIEGKSMGWWRRNVAGIVTWSPETEKERKRKKRKEEKERKRLIKKESRKMTVEDEELARALSWASDPDGGLDDAFDPLQTSKTFDSYGPPIGVLWPPRDVQYEECLDDREWPQIHQPNEATSTSSPASNDNGIGPLPPTYRSEEALRMYSPSHASAEDNSIFFTNARRASSWGQGDKTEYEVQSITSDVMPQDTSGEISDHVMWRPSEGLYVMEQGVLVPVSTSVDDGEKDRDGMNGGSPTGSVVDENIYSNFARPGPGPSTARHRASVVHSGGFGSGSAGFQGNVHMLTPILDDLSSNNASIDNGYSGQSHQDHQSHQSHQSHRHAEDGLDDDDDCSWSEDECDDDDASSEEHVLTFSPGRRVTHYDSNNDDHSICSNHDAI